MTNIPQVSKDQIAKLMAENEKLTEQNNHLKKGYLKAKNTGDNYKSYTLISAIAAVIIAILLIYTYAFEPLFGELRENNNLGSIYKSKAERLQAENQKLDKKLLDLTNELNKSKNETTQVLKDDKTPIYRVQIGAFKMFKMNMYSADFAALYENSAQGFNKYSLGVYNKYSEALKLKKELRKMGFKKAFIVAQYKGKQIGVKEAIKIEKKK